MTSHLPVPPDRHARRLRRAASDEPVRWASLAAVWVHMGIVGVLAWLGSGEVHVPRVIYVSRTTPDGVAPSSAGTAEAAVAGSAASDGIGGSHEGQRPRQQTAPAGRDAPRPEPRHQPPAPAAEAARRDSPPRREALPRPVPPPEPPPVAQGEPPRERFVRTDGLEESPEPVEAELISSRSTRARHERRAVVTSDTLGPVTPRVDGRAEVAGSPTLRWRDGEEVDPAGNVPVEAPRIAAQRASGGGGGGAAGAYSGGGAPSSGGTRLEGGPAARAGGGAGAPGGPGGGGGARTAVPGGPLAERAASSPWWNPMVVRIAPVGPPPSQDSGADPEPPSPSDDEGVAVVETVGARSDRGGTEIVEEDEPALPDPVEEAVGPDPGEAERPVDPVEDLRRALGWGGVDRDRLAPRAAWAGELGREGARPTSPQTVFDEVDIAWEPAVNARGTPLGAYVARLEEAVRRRWGGLDLDAHARAVGVQGQVTVRYVVHASGRVTDVTVSRSSGHIALDRMAVDAIPDRMPRFPRELTQERVFHEIVLRYRNPLVATGMR